MNRESGKGKYKSEKKEGIKKEFESPHTSQLQPPRSLFIDTESERERGTRAEFRLRAQFD